MDKKCWICGREEYIPFKCRFCGKVFCSIHRLPEQHACAGLEYAREHGSGSRNAGNTVPEADDILKGMLKNTAKYAAKSAVNGFGSNIKYSMKSSPSMAIIYLCVFSFILQLVPGYFEALMLVPGLLFERPWTLITHMFLHVGFFHLFFNMLVLFFFGPELERRAGKSGFMRVFFIAGIVAALGYSLTSNAPVVGASGAILGVFAALAVIAPEMRVYVYFIPMKIWHALVLFALIDFLYIGSNDMVAHTAHLSGILVGLLMGFAIRKDNKKDAQNNPYYYYRR
ncbi:rhomboid family intramembrane serine protease [Methanolobus halotolerans]|uniref:Rhomboid family intramembrane serine protease n=1 Tax=Methanolobus halotolerans TaxID=2052935 RepID=A0A4E0PTH2_9EURY|nr:rhomboid family intramembrane serine protease [Methanolobus halotolerans]TGC07482.1 rhomboid family intramembrane serine protease [Methanolobus halotolerans]